MLLQTNVKSVYIFAQAFIPLVKPNATFLSVNAAGAVLPAEVGTGLTGYMSSKIAQAKLMEFIAHEHPEMFVASVHPGVIQTKLLREAELHDSKLPQDTGMSLSFCFKNEKPQVSNFARYDKLMDIQSNFQRTLCCGSAPHRTGSI